ncbi:MAG: hypothetical protein GY822_15245 [Deltaproteobacteria bacterium]|nr:hypothetical protein [Deltaproteobacteria bacterium]
MHDPCIPEVLFFGSLEGSGAWLVLSAPSFPSLRLQVEEGLRIDDARARELIQALLNALTTLQSL